MAESISLANGGEAANFKTRTFAFILYTETNPNHPGILEALRQRYQYLAVKHDRDKDADGNIKPAHWHCIVKFRHPRWRSAVSQEMGIEANLLQDCKNFEGNARYMLHLDDPDKAPYDFEELEGSLKALAEPACIGQETESDRVMRIIELLDAERRTLSMREFVLLLCKAGLYSDCRRGGYIMRELLSEHNVEVEMSAEA